MKTNLKLRSFQFQKPILLIGILLISLSNFGAIIPRLKHGENLKLAAIGTSLTDKGSGNKGWFEHAGEWLNTLPYKGKVTWSNHAVGGSASKTVNSDKGYHQDVTDYSNLVMCWQTKIQTSYLSSLPSMMPSYPIIFHNRHRKRIFKR